MPEALQAAVVAALLLGGQGASIAAPLACYAQAILQLSAESSSTARLLSCSWTRLTREVAHGGSQTHQTGRLCLQKVAAQLDPLSEEGHKEVLNYMRFAEHHLRLDPDSFAGWEHLAREHIQAC